MSEYDFDVLYLGSGHGAFDGAGPLAASGKKVGVIESDMIGGTCPNYGCNAKITLDTPVVLQRMAERMQGIVSGSITINWSELVAHKQAVIKPLPTNIASNLKQTGVTIIHGHGKFIDPHSITVAGKTYTAENMVIATGRRPHHLDIPGTELAHDSRAFMDLKTLPKRIGILGSGYISMEFATIANAAGAEVSVFMHADKALREFHQPFVKAVMADMTKRGVKFIPSADVQALKQTAQGIAIQYGDHQEQQVDWALDATGRIPNDDQIGLEAAGVTFSQRGIPVDDHLRTNVPNIFASGDVLDKPQPKLTPTATFESYYLYQLLSGQTTDPIDYPAIPSTVYTTPRIAKVGVTQKKLLMALTKLFAIIFPMTGTIKPIRKRWGIASSSLIGIIIWLAQLNSVPKRKMRSTPYYQQLSSTSVSNKCGKWPIFSLLKVLQLGIRFGEAVAAIF